VDRFRLVLPFLVIACVAVLGALGPVRGAAALPPPPGGPVASAGQFDPEEHEEEGEDEGESGDEEGEGAGDQREEEADDCEFDDEALEAACEEAEEEKEAEAAAAEECRLQSVEATVAAVPGRNQVRLTVHYKTFEPSAVAIELRSRGGKGGLDLGTDTAHFGRAGTFHSTRTLSGPQMARAMAAREFSIGFHAVNTPGFCGKDFERHLTSRHGAGNGPQWSDPSAARRAKASRD
jgi:hypothetical protein